MTQPFQQKQYVVQMVTNRYGGKEYMVTDQFGFIALKPDAMMHKYQNKNQADMVCRSLNSTSVHISSYDHRKP